MKLIKHPTIPGLFLTREGRVFIELAASPSSFGYRTVKVRKETIRLHTLIAETFIGLSEPGQNVRHLDGNALNNAPENLAWGTQKENATDTILHGKTTRGILNRHVKLTEEQAREIKRRRKSGESGRTLAREFNISEQTIALINTGKQWGWL